MTRRALLFVLTPVLFVGSSLLWSGARSAAAATAAGPGGHGDKQSLQVRAQYVDLDGNRDETNTTLLLVNKSLTRTLVLGGVLALGQDGLSEVLATDDALDGVVIPPLGTLEVLVDSIRFPGLQPVRVLGERGVASVVVGYAGPRDALRLTASIHLLQPGSVDNRVITIFEGHDVEK